MILTNEEEARQWLRDALDVPRGTMERLESFVALLQRENERQNLVSSSTLVHVWRRHIVDSAQLLLHAPASGEWLDVGSGAGFPGLVIAALHAGPVTLVEPRKLRVAFLNEASALLGIAPTIVQAKMQSLPPRSYNIISARAVAALPALLRMCQPFSTEKTRFIFPKGRAAQTELDEARSAWQGSFRTEPSLTEEEARVVIAEGLRGREPGKRR